MFQSATLKLTAWYAGILIVFSILFSVAIYQISVHEVGDRLQRFQGYFEDRSSLPMQTNPLFRSQQLGEASNSLILQLVYINIGILVAGSTASYFLARRTLRPVEEAHMAQVRFTSDASHELRTPLAVMKSEIEVTLRDKNAPVDELREILESNLEEVNNLSRLSEMLLALSKMDHEKLTLVPVSTSLLAKKVIERFKQPTTRLILETKGAGKIKGNEPSLTELMTILIDNALKYSPADSQVLVRVFTKGDVVSFEVQNEGKGISAEALDHIFDRFYRADSSRTGGQTKGFGLGLSIAKQLADINHATISASSAPDETTIFTLHTQKAKIQ